MKAKNNSYRKNFTLLISFMVLITISLVLALIFGYNLTKKYVENEFTASKIDVLEKTIAPYNTLFQNKIPEISFYQGFLDSTSAEKYAVNVLKDYPFVEKVLFYDAQVSNHLIEDGLRFSNFSVGIKKLYQFGKGIDKKNRLIFDGKRPGSLSLSSGDEFNKISLKLASFIETADTTKALTSEQIFRVFYSIVNNKISYMNIPRRDDIKIYQDLMFKKSTKSPFYEQDVFTFELNSSKLKIVNNHPQLYQYINIKPLSYDPILEKPNLITTDIALPGPFSDYKIFFGSEQQFLTKEVNHRFYPIALAVFSVYLILGFITFLIYRNLKIKLTNLKHLFL
jgi:two-component system phosphate regulon sensor histidine kinase PhoR